MKVEGKLKLFWLLVVSFVYKDETVSVVLDSSLNRPRVNIRLQG